MSDNTRRYNGWTNRATWLLNLHMSNEEGVYIYWTERAETIAHRSDDNDEAVQRLAAEIKAEVEDGGMIGEQFTDDLLPDNYTNETRGRLFASIDYEEVAAAWIEDTEA